MHRSGTSAITRGLSALGVPLGNNLMPPVLNNNNKGFFEDLEINELNTELLTALNRAWDDLSRVPPESLQSEAVEPLKLRAIELMRTKIGDQTFGFKNPRMARLLPFWQAVFKELDIRPFYVIAIRNPKAWRSLCRREMDSISRRVTTSGWNTSFPPSLKPEGQRESSSTSIC